MMFFCMNYISNDSNILQQDNNITIDINEEQDNNITMDINEEYDIEQNNMGLQDNIINGIDNNLELNNIINNKIHNFKNDINTMKRNRKSCDKNIFYYHNESRLLIINVLKIAIKLANLNCPKHTHDKLMENIQSLLRSIDEHQKGNIVPNLCDDVFAFSRSIKDLDNDINVINDAAKIIQNLAFDIEEIQNEYELYIKIAY